MLALDLYLKSGRRVLEQKRPETIALAATLNRLHASESQSSTVPARRSAGSVKAKLANLRAVDPETESTGFGNGSRLDLEVWNEFANDPAALSREVRAILRSINS